MELKEFIKNVLIDLIDGVKEAQEYAVDNDARIVPSVRSKTTKGDNIETTHYTTCRDVSFEVDRKSVV